MPERLRILFGLSIIAILLGSGILMTVFVLKQEEAQIDRDEWQETQRVLNDLVATENERRAQTSTQPPSTASQVTAIAKDGQRISINTATKTELDRLPGIGEARATALVEARASGGPFRDLDDIRARVPKIPASVLEQIALEITFD